MSLEVDFKLMGLWVSGFRFILARIGNELGSCQF
jgi:hypothetical protein